MAVTSAGWARPRTETWSVVPGAAMRGRHVAQGDGPVEAWAQKPPLVTLPIGGAGGIEDLGAFAGGRAFDEEADADAAGLAGELGEDAGGCREVARPRGGAC